MKKLALLFSLTIVSINLTHSQCNQPSEYPGGVDAFNQSMYFFNEYYKADQYTEALPIFEKIYTSIPGVKEVVLTRGANIYGKFLETETDTDKITTYKNRIVEIHEKRQECFCKKDQAAKEKCKLDQAFDLYYYNEDNTKSFEIFKSVFETGTKNITYHYINPFSELTVKLLELKSIDAEIAKKSKDQIYTVINHHLSLDVKKEKYEESKAYADQLFANVFTLMYNCSDFELEAQQKYDSSVKDLSSKMEYISFLDQYGCQSGSMYNSFKKDLEPADVKSLASQARMAKESGDISGAIALYEQDAQSKTGLESAKSYYQIAYLYYDMNKYSSAIAYARKSLSAEESWGKPNILIGLSQIKLAKSCGSDFDGKMVVSAALNKFYAAKKDSNSAEEAQKLIDTYSGTLPTKAELFQRGISEGSSYKIDCIGESTIVKGK